ncbi:ABC transporter ATP-binding protein [Picrophilus oshimae]|uniref:Oligopeptide ABC transporter Opp2, ATP binding protein n=1 Tax=Picrophilus torridus (strain ATCC 700027 / DSM 9790 / JCM 10055 / NBRC 100828 / KAW 2/3) TaxID=1122961 RepID=Q6KZ17_PICTO|nr:ABC transporter ATP-binding protein [Picrophilus oshimae]AAT44035.1 oligopeptide ABC transporter Opp2, ATP binding protein [Picrophilus oshimae DSM 9789]
MSNNILEVKNLNAGYMSEGGYIRVVNDVSFEIKVGEILGIAGESGSGKTTLVSAIYNSLTYPGIIESGTVLFGGKEILKMSREELRQIRGVDITYVPQGSMDSLNPVKTIENQFNDLFISHGGNITREYVINLLNSVGLSESVLSKYPHEISGGMKQRVIIAMALLYRPKLVVMDEPTTGLDVLVQYEILKMIKNMQKNLNLSIIIITHDISLLFQIADRIMVLYGGEILEFGNYKDLLSNPKHPYTKLLLDSIPSILRPVDKLATIPGEPMNFISRPEGCVFYPRCPFSKETCSRIHPELYIVDNVEYRCLRFPEWAKEVNNI